MDTNTRNIIGSIHIILTILSRTILIHSSIKYFSNFQIKSAVCFYEIKLASYTILRDIYAPKCPVNGSCHPFWATDYPADSKTTGLEAQKKYLHFIIKKLSRSNSQLARNHCMICQYPHPRRLNSRIRSNFACRLLTSSNQTSCSIPACT